MSSKNRATEPDPEAVAAGEADGGSAVPDSLEFEEAVGRLEDIVRRMEEEQVPLDVLIRDYETGNRLLRVCRKRIEAARSRIEQIGQGSRDGEVALEDFDPPEGEPSAPEVGKNVRLL